MATSTLTQLLNYERSGWVYTYICEAVRLCVGVKADRARIVIILVPII